MLTNSRYLFSLFVLIAVSIFALFVAVGYSAGHGKLLMPLDDVYIHFQYAKQMALGQPYVYNPGQVPTSGATSFLYPYLLAFGYLIGFKGLWLGLWAMLIGLVALIAAQWAVYRLCQSFDCSQWLSILTTVGFTLTGPVAWHFMSGMETGLMIALTLWTLFMVVNKRLRGCIIVGTLLALMRPEGGILVLIAVGTMCLRLWRDYGAHEKRTGKRHLLLLLLIPALAIGVQPLVNLMVTGSMVATGNQAKSILATVPHYWDSIIGRIWDNFVRMWWEFITGYDAREGRGWYLPLFTGIFALAAIVMLMFQRGMRLIGWMLLGWLLALTAAISTLDTAFWHFKRYQMPMMALFFPLAAYVIAWLLQRPLPKSLPASREGLFRVPIYVYSFAIVPTFAIALLVQFVNYHRLNVGYVYQQPYQMALWLRENTPEDAVVAVHDVGMMRYMGERTTLDMVGLTTPGAAAYWRNGPGSVAEFLINEQPDYIASYGRGHGYGLAYLADTSLYGEPLASFPIEDWNRQANVALAADFQGIYQPNWDGILYSAQQTTTNLQLCNPPSSVSINSMPICWMIDVADIQSETYTDYQWVSTNKPGFVSEFRSLNYRDLPILGGYRLIDTLEAFNLDVESISGETIVLFTSIHTQSRGTLDFYVNGEYIGTKWVYEAPGNMTLIPTLIDSEFIHDKIRVEIHPHMENGFYMPIAHGISVYHNFEYVNDPVALAYVRADSGASYLDGSFYLHDLALQRNASVNEPFRIGFYWYTVEEPQGDYRFFVHLYDDLNQPPIAQWDGYFAGMPVGNWLPGMISDTITLDIADVPPGTYSLAIGFYNPQTGERLVPTSDRYEVSPDGRLWLGEVTIGDEISDTQD